MVWGKRKDDRITFADIAVKYNLFYRNIRKCTVKIYFIQPKNQFVCVLMNRNRTIIINISYYFNLLIYLFFF